MADILRVLSCLDAGAFLTKFSPNRAFALQRHRPLTLDASINLPSINDDPTDSQPHLLNSFIHQVNLFRPYDNALVALWTKTRDDCSPYLPTLQKQLQEALPSYLVDTRTQLAELPMTQQWLKNTAWQLSVASGNGSENGPYPYSIDIAGDLLPMATRLSGNLGMRGLALLDKLFSVTCALTETLASQPPSRDPFSIGPREHLHQILNVLSVIRNGDHQFLPLLLSKVHDAVPRLANPMLQNAPESALAAAACIDIFDGFGNAGMAQVSVYPCDEYESKYALPRVDEMNTDTHSSSGGPPSSNDMNSPFVSSPPIMSPGIDGANGLAGDFTSMPDLVMSPLSHAPPSSLGTPNGMNGQPSQHSQHPSMSAFQSMGSQLQTMGGNISPPPDINTTMGPSMGIRSQIHLSHGLNHGMNHAMHGHGLNHNHNHNLTSRPQPQRTASFALPPQVRTVGDFQALQRANSGMDPMSPLGMNPMGTEINFNTLPR